MSDVSSATNYFPTVNEGFITTVAAPGISSGASTVPLANISGLTNGTTFVGIVEPGLTNQQVFTGIVDTAGTQITGVHWTRGSNVAHATGTTIVDYVTGTDVNLITTGIRKEHTTAGVHTLTSASTLTSSKVITSLNDTNGNELLKVTPTASAVNEFTVANAATGSGPTLSVTGGDPNIDMNFAPKGTGQYKGIVEHLYNPYKFNVHLAAHQTGVVDATITKVLFDTEKFDTNNNFASSTYTVPVSGFYQINGFAWAQSANNNGVACSFYLYKNGTGIQDFTRLYPSVAASNVVDLSGSLSTCIQLTAGDTLDVRALMDVVSGTVTIVGGTTGTSFSGFLMSTT